MVVLRNLTLNNTVYFQKNNELLQTIVERHYKLLILDIQGFFTLLS